jgi:hypothetical protein
MTIDASPTPSPPPDSTARRNFFITIGLLLVAVVVAYFVGQAVKQPAVTTAGMSYDDCRKQPTTEFTGTITKNIDLGGAEVDNKTLDFSKATVKQSGKDDYPINLRPVKKSVCVIGSLDRNNVEGDYPASVSWWDTKEMYNGAGINGETGNISVHRMRMNNIANDAVRISRWEKDAPGSILVNQAYFTNIRDDCVSNITHLDTIITDSYMECYTAYSWRSEGDHYPQTQHATTISDSLIWLKPQTASGGNCFDGKPPTQGSQDGVNAAGAVWKMDKYKGTPAKVKVTNVIYRMDNSKGRDCESTFADGTYNNVTIVYTGEGDKPANVPSSIKVTKDLNTWNTAVKNWKKQHGVK